MVKIYRCSDDSIEIDGDILQEFRLGLNADSGICFSCGTFLRTNLKKDGVWEIFVIDEGRANISYTPAGDSDNDFGDMITINSTEPVVWAVALKENAYVHNGRFPKGNFLGVVIYRGTYCGQRRH